MSTRPGYTTATVTSADGTTIGYRQLGAGPGVVLLHGGVNGSQHLMTLGAALAVDFTVHIPDRRGRGLSGPLGPDYDLGKEDEDLTALLDATGARNVFGTADGALFALHAAIGRPDIERVAAYEPLLFLDQPGLAGFVANNDRFNREVAEGQLAQAMVTAIQGTGRPPALARAPRALLAPLLDLGLRFNARRVRGDDVALRDLLDTLPREIELVKSTEGTIEEYSQVGAEVLLLHGSRTDDLFAATASALAAVIPHSTSLTIPGLDHGAVQDYGQPAQVAPLLALFFGRATALGGSTSHRPAGAHDGG